MQREDIALAAQLLKGMQDVLEKLAEAQNKKDIEKANAAKRELLHFQRQLQELL